MLLAEPPPSQGDLHFRLFDIPVRVHPFFWLTPVLLAVGRDTTPGELLIWVSVVFVSILVHELGHAFTQRHFGGRPWITLHGIGGLASCDDCDDRPSSQILIALAGPAAGFLFAAVILAGLAIAGAYFGWTRDFAGWTESEFDGVGKLSMLGGVFYWDRLSSDPANDLVRNLLHVNILWGLINLLPVYPLDGGRVSRELCTLQSPRGGIILSLRISMIAAALMAAVGLIAWRSPFTALMFGYLAYTSYATLQAYQHRGW